MFCPIYVYICAAWWSNNIIKTIFDVFTLVTSNRSWKFQEVSEKLQFSKTIFWENTVFLSQIWCFSKKNHFEKLQFLSNFLEFLRTVWGHQSKNIKYCFYYIIGPSGRTYIYIYGAEHTYDFKGFWDQKIDLCYKGRNCGIVEGEWSTKNKWNIKKLAAEQ